MKTIGFIILFVVLVILGSILTASLWDDVMPVVFNLPKINPLQAFELGVLAMIFLKN